MSLSDALQSAVSGLGAHSRQTGKISDNIANANTTGYKRSFADFVTSSASSMNGATAPRSASVRAELRSDIDQQGSILSTNVHTDLAIVGDGFFVVGAETNREDALNFSLTRAGSFRKTEDGFLRNSAGFYLYGFPYDETGHLGVVDRNSFSDLKPINLDQVRMIGSATSEIILSGNLPAQESGKTGAASFASNFEFFDALGVPDRLVLTWTPGSMKSEWQLAIGLTGGQQIGTVDVRFHDSGPLAGTPQEWTNATSAVPSPALFAFDPTTGTARLSLDKGSVPQQISVGLGAPGSLNGVTQFSGDFRIEKSRDDGAEAGNLTSVQVGADGEVFGIFDNGQRRLVYQLPLASVPNPSGLRQGDGNTYAPTRHSGRILLKKANDTAGTIAAGSIERSNVDLARELTNLIETQRSYTTNAKVITAVDEMMEETTWIVR